MMMKRHMLGLDNDSDLNHQLGFKNTDIHCALPVQIISEPKIVNKSLLLRTQYVMFFPSRDFSNGWTEIQPDITICRHLKYNATRLDFQKPDNYHYPGSPYMIYSGLGVHRLWLEQFLKERKSVPSIPMRRCRHCTTEYRVDVQAWGQDSGVSIITRWIDLGSGRSIKDPKWWSRLPNTYTSHPKFSGVERDNAGDTWARMLDLDFERGAICQAFEQKAWEDFDPTLDLEQISELAAKHPDIDASKVVYIKPSLVVDRSAFGY
jgi:hypothetical protein